jgi:hypothetical protein
MFNSRSNINTPILEKNLDFAPSPTVESNIPDHDEDFQKFPSNILSLLVSGTTPSMKRRGGRMRTRKSKSEKVNPKKRWTESL